MLITRNLNLAFGERHIFKDVSFSCDASQKIGLVGRNGAGKSTMLRALAGQQALDSGTILFEKGKKFAYLPQEVLLQSKKNILDEAFSTFDELQKLQLEYTELDNYFNNPENDAGDVEKLERYAHLQEQLAESDYDSLLLETKRILQGLGFKPEKWEKTVDTLSVGWKMRLVLAKLLLQKADFYLFDEPTNHLDIVAKEWFVSFLQECSFGYLLVSHDRYFLDHVCDYIFELDRGVGKLYYGNYSQYLAQREQAREHLEKAYVQQQKDIKAKEEFVERFKAKASKAKMAQSVLKSLEKIERIELDRTQAKVNVRFGEIQRPGKIVLQVEGVAQAFDGNPLFRNVSFEINRDEKVALVAANGVGKTTLMSIIMKKLPLQTGSVTFGYNVTPAFFEQDQDKTLNHKNTIIQEVEASCMSETQGKIRTLLGTFLFPKDDVHKKIGVLSGGEKNRVAMVKVLLQNANFLILDEPTNHLDLESKEVLLSALQQYPGTILFVSHDREFLSNLATKIIALDVDGAASYPGSYDEYLYCKEQEEKARVVTHEPTASSNKKIAPKPELDEASKKKNAKKLEAKIEKLEAEIVTIGNSFADAEYGTPEYDSLLKRLDQVQKERDTAFAQWEESLK
jgi:ATP-binding cassette subfamily F protein 3